MVTEIVDNYENLVSNIGQLIEISGYRNDYVAKKLGLTKVNFSAKKNRRTFTLEEIRKIVAIIDNEDVEDYLMVQQMHALRDEPTISLEEFEREMGWK